MDNDLLETVWANVLGLVVAAITNIGHEILSLEATTNSVVNTLWFAPVRLQKSVNR